MAAGDARRRPTLLRALRSADVGYRSDYWHADVLVASPGDHPGSPEMSGQPIVGLPGGESSRHR